MEWCAAVTTFQSLYYVGDVSLAAKRDKTVLNALQIIYG